MSTNFKKGDKVVRAGQANGRYARVGQVATVVEDHVEDRLVQVEYPGHVPGYDGLPGEGWCSAYVEHYVPTTPMQKLATPEHIVACIKADFETTQVVLDLNDQLDCGLITSVEFSRKILAEWELFSTAIAVELYRSYS